MVRSILRQIDRNYEIKIIVIDSKIETALTIGTMIYQTVVVWCFVELVAANLAGSKTKDRFEVSVKLVRSFLGWPELMID